MLLGKHINKYYLKYIWLYLIGVVGLVAVDWFQLLLPEYLGQIVDLFGGDSIDTSALQEVVVGVIFVALVLFTGRVMWRFSIFNASQKTEAGLRRQMFIKAEKLPLSYYGKTKVGTVMAWFTTDLETIEEFLGWGTIMLFDASFLTVLVIIKMVRLDWALSLIVAVPLILIAVWGALVEKFQSAKWTERQNEFDKLYDFSRESFTGIRVIKAFLTETRRLHEFAKIVKKNKAANVSYARLTVLFDCLISLIIAVITAIILGVGGYFAYSAVTGNPAVIFGHAVKMTAGDLVTFLGYFETMIWPMMALGQIVSMRSRAKASLKRVSAFLDSEEVKDRGNAVILKDVKGGISFKNFTFFYPESDTPALKNITLDIAAGEKIGIIGKVGSGKTTLVNSLFKIYETGEGQVFLDGEDIALCNTESVRNALAYAPQDNFLFSDTLANNIGFALDGCPRNMVERAAEFACLSGDIQGFKDGYDTVCGERGVTLSGGQKQRAAIARAYIKDAPVLVLDDSVSAVDIKTEEAILSAIDKERAGKTTIVVASRASTVARFDRIIVLSDGGVEAFASPEELLKISPTYQKMVRLQALENQLKGGGI
ncbi:MAG: ABC transporter ATP-binding protein/permease [Clostridiales bacterium]|nr:ABC transporter ATP-binding protein/permease [Clostridiales bacterium]